MPVFDTKGEKIEDMKLPDAIFGVSPSKTLLAQYVRVYLANQRQGTASTKTRSEVVGSTRKIYRQKGTGRARHGAIKAPIFVGGGVAHGPRPKDFSLTLNKKQKRKALLMALSLKHSRGDMISVKDMLTVEPKTKHMRQILIHLKLAPDTQKIGRILLVYPPASSEKLIRASRNLDSLHRIETQSINPYELLRAHKVIFVHEGLDAFFSTLIKKEKRL